MPWRATCEEYMMKVVRLIEDLADAERDLAIYEHECKIHGNEESCNRAEKIKEDIVDAKNTLEIYARQLVRECMAP